LFFLKKEPKTLALRGLKSLKKWSLAHNSAKPTLGVWGRAPSKNPHKAVLIVLF
jgi:hypothetical protein